MKNISSNTCLIIRWSFVAALFAGTVAIAVDQVRIRDREIAKLKPALAEMSKLANQVIGVASKNNQASIENAEASIASLTALQNSEASKAANISEHLTLMAEWTQLEKDAKVIVARLTAAEAVRKAAKTTTEKETAVAAEKRAIAEVNEVAARMKANGSRRKILTSMN